MVLRSAGENGNVHDFISCNFQDKGLRAETLEVTRFLARRFNRENEKGEIL